MGTGLSRVMAYLQASPSPYHVVATLASALESAGFTELLEADPWELHPGGRHFVIRGQGSLIAFRLPAVRGTPPSLRLVGAHTDSPGLLVKPRPLVVRNGHLVWDVEVYGSPILATWFDRELSLAGLVSCRGSGGEIGELRVDWRLPLAILPNAAIHLNREVNEGHRYQRHEELQPVCRVLSPGEKVEEPTVLFRRWLGERIGVEAPAWAGAEPLGWELSFYEARPACRVGLEGEWLVGGRLDNQLSCFIGLQSLLEVAGRGKGEGEIGLEGRGGEGEGETALPMLACFHHEEVGSLSLQGAAGQFAESVIRRILPRGGEAMARTMARSALLSVDNAHALHPNYGRKHDEGHRPLLNGGIVVKSNANQRYTTDASSGGRLKGLCRRLGVPWQEFAMRADLPCGSTIGPHLAARLGLPGVDIGVPTWAMHSIRETAGLADLESLGKLLKGFFVHGLPPAEGGNRF
ncbi:MAG: M18 family aminopeptidase [Magnetococcales bacterium]|nr:M18 family aminopeptidase [Magnetococcales bacterium]